MSHGLAKLLSNGLQRFDGVLRVSEMVKDYSPLKTAVAVFLSWQGARYAYSLFIDLRRIPCMQVGPDMTKQLVNKV